MSVSLNIVPVVDHVDMYGAPDTNSAYSLDGAIIVRIAPPFSIWNRPKTSRILLRSLRIVFEGSSAVLGPSGFSSVRICSVERELIMGTPVEMNNDGLEDCCWNVLYNLPIPGWLPQSSDDMITMGTCYAIYATAQFTILDDNNASSFWNLCLPIQSRRIKTATASKLITLKRFASPPPSGAVAPTRSFLIDPSAADVDISKHQIPFEIVSKIRILASVPQFVDINSSCVPFTLRFRSQDIDEETASRLHVTDLKFTLTQTEQLNYSASPSYPRFHLLPDASLQPPNVPLRELNAFHDLANLEFLQAPTLDNAQDSKTYSLLPSPKCGLYHVQEETRVFRNTGSNPNSWYTMDFTMPFQRQGLRSLKGSSIWSGNANLRPTTKGPLSNIEHALTIYVDCMYEKEDGSQTRETLKFTTTVVFASFAPPPNHQSISLNVAQVVSAEAGSVPALPPSVPYAATLPVYSQLYENNGDRRVDYSTPLPVYTLVDDSLASTSEERKAAEAADSESEPLLS